MVAAASLQTSRSHAPGSARLSPPGRRGPGSAGARKSLQGKLRTEGFLSAASLYSHLRDERGRNARVMVGSCDDGSRSPCPASGCQFQQGPILCPQSSSITRLPIRAPTPRGAPWDRVRNSPAHAPPAGQRAAMKRVYPALPNKSVRTRHHTATSQRSLSYIHMAHHPTSITRSPPYVNYRTPMGEIRLSVRRLVLKPAPSIGRSG